MALIISARSLADLSRARFTPKLEQVFKMSKSKDVAKSYQHVSLFQREEGKKLIDDVQIYHGYVILDLGCGTGELSAYLYRVEVARESHREVKNLTLQEGSSMEWARRLMTSSLPTLCFTGFRIKKNHSRTCFGA